ncbi:MAG: transcriptional regulator, Crp/Fnr family [Caulobacteraceae bacterium]|jgi:CRP-like cAMP-binding protein|nr:transcriptional regulator, Crp/Fnr family [Caulobacteraceae bacterium]
MTASSHRAQPPVSAAVVCRRLESLAPLGPASLGLLLCLDDLQTHEAGCELVSERAPHFPSRFLISGWAARVRWLADGRRQILGFLLPGDGIGLCLRPHPLALATTVALTPLVTIDAEPVMRAVGGPAPPEDLAAAMQIASSMDEAALLNQVVRLGRQTAYERMCHLLLELYDRLSDVGLAEDQTFPMPLTQELVSDALGLSVVHVNRILQQLRREGLLDLRTGRASLLDIEQLRDIADYERPQPSRWRSFPGSQPMSEAPA